MSRHCPCPSCHKNCPPLSHHSSSCCFTPDVSFRKKKIEMKVRDTYCSTGCELTAFRLFKREPSLKSLIDAICRDFYVIQSEKLEFQKILEDKLPTLSKNHTIDGQFLPNFVGSFRYNLNFDLFKKIIDLGFCYDANDKKFIDYIVGKIEKKQEYPTKIPENNHWFKSFLEKDRNLSIKVSNKYMEYLTGITLNLELSEGVNQNNNNNNQDNKKQKTEEQ